MRGGAGRTPKPFPSPPLPPPPPPPTPTFLLLFAGQCPRALAPLDLKETETIATQATLPRVSFNYGKKNISVTNEQVLLFVCAHGEHVSCEPASEGSLAQEKNFPSAHRAAPPARNKQERRLPAYRRNDQSGKKKQNAVDSLYFIYAPSLTLEAGNKEECRLLVIFHRSRLCFFKTIYLAVFSKTNIYSKIALFIGLFSSFLSG